MEWLSHVPRLQFTQGALYEIGSALSLFQVKSYAEEFRAMVGDKRTCVAGGPGPFGGPGH